MDVVFYRSTEPGSEPSVDGRTANLQLAGFVAYESIQGYPLIDSRQLAAYSHWFGWNANVESAPDDVVAELAVARPHFDSFWVRSRRRTGESMVMGKQNGRFYPIVRWSADKCTSEEAIAAVTARVNRRFAIILACLTAALIAMICVAIMMS